MSMRYRYSVAIIALLAVCVDAFAQNGLPSALKYSSYFGTAGEDGIWDMAIDKHGYVYLLGGTDSPTFPLKNPTFQPNHKGKRDFYLLKFTPGMDSIIWSTFYGGMETDWYGKMRLFQDSIIYIAGETFSGNLRMVGNSYQKRFGGESDVFVARFNTITGLCTASTFIGGSGNERPLAMEIDEKGFVYIAGATAWASDYPTTPNAFQPSYGGGQDDGFITKISGDLQSVIYSTFLGGYDIDEVDGIAFDSVGNIYACGATLSANFPVTEGAYQAAYNNEDEGYIVKLDSTCGVLLASTFFGTIIDEVVLRIRVGPDGNIYTFGETDSPDLPTTQGVLFPTPVPVSDELIDDLFFAKFTPDLSQLLVCSYFGGYYREWMKDFYFLSDSRIIFSGITQGHQFPITQNAFQHDWQGRDDAFVAIVTENFDSLIYSSYVGGDHYDNLMRMCVVNDTLYLAGATESSNYPVTSDAYQSTYAGNNDGFITKFSLMELLPVEWPLNAPVPLRELAVYPNPAVSVASLSFTLPNPSEARLAVYNALGKLVLEQSLGTLPSGTHSAMLNARQLEAGTYLCRIYAGKELITGRFIVQR